VAVSAENERNRLATAFVVEATSEELMGLWLEWAEEAKLHGCGSPGSRRIAWEQISLGYHETIGTLGGMPVAVSVTFARVLGRVVAFYEGVSQVVDHRLVRAWADKAFPASKGHCNAANFHHCVLTLESA
jgi:hypothetical protein